MPRRAAHVTSIALLHARTEPRETEYIQNSEYIGHALTHTCVQTSSEMCAAAQYARASSSSYTLFSSR